jgi:type VI secretion system protein ImpA
MPLIDIEALTSEISPESPCGEDLSGEAAYFELDRLVQGTQEQVMGDAVIEAEEPSWADVGRQAVDLLGRSRDLRIAIYLTLAALRIEGLAGLRDGLAVLRALLEQQWDRLHPLLDPDDDNDPTERINIIEQLAQPEGSFGDPLRFIRRLYEAPLCESRQLGRFCFRDAQMAQGAIPPPEGHDPPSEAIINGAFDETETEELQGQAQAAAEAAEHLAAIDTFLIETVGAAQAAQLDSFRKAIVEVGGVLQAQLARRGYGAPEIAGEVAVEAATGDAAAPAQALRGEITSDQDVLRAIDKICTYYEKNEPSSPVPLILRRAQRLVAKNFIECIQDLSPGAMSEIQTITGIDTGAQE